MEYQVKLLSSLEKVFFDWPEKASQAQGASMMKNEIHAFQLVLQMNNENTWPRKTVCRVEVESPLADRVKIYQVGYVPSLLPAYADSRCDDYLGKKPGLFPDPLYPMKDGRICLPCGQTRSVWISVEPDGSVIGACPIELRLYDEQEQQVAQEVYHLQIIDAVLPELSIYNTGWFHGDCIAALHNLRLQSDAYFETLEKYLHIYKKFGHNTILTPVFTPPLDTDIGGERPTNQLVGVTVNKGKYIFDFSLLRRWIAICKRVGLQFFEISHLYTQWGARYAPKIMATVDGTYRRIFGWETDALGEAYTAFLESFLPELTAVLQEEGIMEHCLFHVSDEPARDHGPQYMEAKRVLLRYIPEAQMIDALGEFELYKSGAVRHPVVSNDHVQTFLNHGVTDLWTYFCCSQGERVANRFMSMPSHRNRVLGAQLYKYHIKGFLQWGFNFWFSQGSVRVIDPYRTTCADGGFPSGDAFLVYPMIDGDVIASLRLYVFNDTMQDHRALCLLESMIGREKTEEMLADIQGFEDYPRNSAYYLDLREKINQKIKEYLQRI